MSTRESPSLTATKIKFMRVGKIRKQISRQVKKKNSNNIFLFGRVYENWCMYNLRLFRCKKPRTRSECVQIVTDQVGNKIIRWNSIFFCHMIRNFCDSRDLLIFYLKIIGQGDAFHHIFIILIILKITKLRESNPKSQHPSC